MDRTIEVEIVEEIEMNSYGAYGNVGHILLLNPKTNEILKPSKHYCIYGDGKKEFCSVRIIVTEDIETYELLTN